MALQEIDREYGGGGPSAEEFAQFKRDLTNLPACVAAAKASSPLYGRYETAAKVQAVKDSKRMIEAAIKAAEGGER